MDKVTGEKGVVMFPFLLVRLRTAIKPEDLEFDFSVSIPFS